MSFGEVISFLMVLAAWIAVYWQRRGVKRSERELETRIYDLEKINARITAEQNAREAHINDRISAHNKLEVNSVAKEIADHSLNLDIYFVSELLLYQQFALLYLSRQVELDAKDSALRAKFSHLLATTISFVGRRNYVRLVQRSLVSAIESDYERVSEAIKRETEAIKRETKALEDAVLAGQDLAKGLEANGAFTWPNGAPMDECFVPIRETISDLNSHRKKLNDLLGTSL